MHEVKYEVVEVKSNEVIGYVDRAGLELFCDTVGVWHKGIKGESIGFPGKFVFVRHEKIFEIKEDKPDWLGHTHGKSHVDVGRGKGVKINKNKRRPND